MTKMHTALSRHRHCVVKSHSRLNRSENDSGMPVKFYESNREPKSCEILMIACLAVDTD